MTSGDQTLRTLESIPSRLRRRTKQLVGSLVSQWSRESRSRGLIVKETLSLGEKRFLALVEVDGERLLIGGGANSVRMLKRLKITQAPVISSVEVLPNGPVYGNQCFKQDLHDSSYAAGSNLQ